MGLSQEWIISYGDYNEGQLKIDYSLDNIFEKSRVVRRQVSSIGMSNRRTRYQTHAPIYLEDEQDLIGGVGWKMYQKCVPYDHSGIKPGTSAFKNLKYDGALLLLPVLLSFTLRW